MMFAPTKCSADRLQTGMRGTFDKPLGTVAQVHIGYEVIMPVRAKENYQDNVTEALRSVKLKFPGMQKIAVSNFSSEVTT